MAAIAMTIAPASGFSQNSGGTPEYLKPRFPVMACRDEKGNIQPAYGCVSTGPQDMQAIIGEAGRVILDRETFHRCHHATKASTGPQYSKPTVGWGTYIDTPDEMAAGQCPQLAPLQNWFMRDLNASYTRGRANAQALGLDKNGCMVRTLTAFDHQMGDMRRKFPDTWAKLKKGEICAVAETMLAWSSYRHSCVRTLDTILALNRTGSCNME